MRVGIDISQVVYKTGVSWYTKNLVENILKLDKKNEYILFGGSLRQIGNLKNICSDFKGNVKKKLYLIPPVLADIVWNKFHSLPIENLIGKVDVFHSSDWTQPPTSAYKVTTIHDLTALINPESSQKDGIRDVAKAHRERFKWVKREVDKIIAVSKSTKSDIVKYLDIPEDKIVVIYEAPDPVYKKHPKGDIIKVKEKYKIEGNYIFTVGTAKRKNIDRLYEAYKLLKINDIKLVVAGNSYLESKEGLVGIMNPNNYEVSCLYSGAEALVYPSLYEGFGLPILEAFACGCPVVTSNLSSMPEIAGDAAILVDPLNTDSIANGIKEAFQKRNILLEKGNTRLKSFSWNKTAEETIKVYEESQ